jgi:hypothetical protein
MEKKNLEKLPNFISKLLTQFHDPWKIHFNLGRLMNLRSLLYLTVTACIFAGLLAGLSFVPKLLHTPYQPFLDFNQINGMAVSHHGTLFTLNFEQQNAVIESINTSIPHPDVQSSLPYQAIMVYTFAKSDITITPLGYVNDNLVFVVPSWNQGKPLAEQTKGKLKKILEQTFD